MNILLISECSKNALTETRRILDQFAERRGERTWQTPITLQGLDTLRRLLRKTARKNTAVACHWIRGKDHSELLWIVGDASRFNAQGAVPTNTTGRDILRHQDENDWHTAEDMRLLAALAGLFHDFGKANQAFQDKLKKSNPVADALRHEWISLRLFEAFVGKNNDREWLERLANLPNKPDESWVQTLIKDQPKCEEQPNSEPVIAKSPFRTLPPLAQAVGWLIVTHHRLPTQAKGTKAKGTTEDIARLPGSIHADWCGWRPAALADIEKCWTFKKPLPVASQAWRARARRLALHALNRPQLLTSAWLDNPYAMHLSRLALMLADHHYSSLTHPIDRVKGDARYALLANTDRKTGLPNQPLDEHLIGVAYHSSRIARLLPLLERHLPRIARHRGFSKRSIDKRFRWQDTAYDLAVSLQTRAKEHGFFGVNMASTGCGKTLANGRIMYGLADPLRGARFSIALGLRTLTLQTGQAYRERLQLGSDDLAVLVGGAAVRDLFERQQAIQKQELFIASESAENLLPDDSYVHFEGSVTDGPFNTWLDHTPGAKALLNAPILTCTIDHLMPATESTRGGHQIAPILRLLTADLVLDEPDDFDLDDLPALTRLVHWAGLLGSRVLLSSATLPPALIQGLFAAYLVGRHIYQRNRGVPNQPLQVCGAWFDEFNAQGGQYDSIDGFMIAQREFVAARLKKLALEEIRRRAVLQSLALPPGVHEKNAIHQAVAARLHELLHELHAQHHSTDPHSGKRVSFGLIRLAHIDPLIDVACELLKLGAHTGYYIHLCCYHSQHPLLIRSTIEAQLDRLLKRQNPEKDQPDPLFAIPELRAVLDNRSEPNQLFVVLATPVAEVGRDHDYDWGIVEPSSMRSIIQLAGRIRRHRSGICTTPNLYLLETNIKNLCNGVSEPAFCRPGFERKDFKLNSHNLHDVLTPEQFSVISAAPRIQARAELHPRTNLVDLEHERLQALMIGDGTERVLVVECWWTTRAGLSGELQRTSPFRCDPQGRIRYALVPDEDTGKLIFRCFRHNDTPTDDSHLFRPLPVTCAPGIGFWGEFNYMNLLEELADEKEMDLVACAERFGVVELAATETQQIRGWSYHAALGFGSYR